MVMATQNPIEQEGTYPLPEAQLDRFLMKVSVDYPPDAATSAPSSAWSAARSRRSTAGAPRGAATPIPQQAVFDARAALSRLTVADAIEDYIVALVCATRDAGGARQGARHGWIEIGASPRASIALDRAARAHAWLAARTM